MNQAPNLMFFSVIIPVYNRPDEVNELLQSLTTQEYTNFEVLIIEDGSTERCREVVKSYKGKLDISYFYKENSGQGFSRNYGFERAKGDYLVVFDSDCLIPPHYFRVVREQIEEKKLDAYGGPDSALDSFTPLQQAINYSMTSIFTTGGIRGGEKHSGAFHPRSFNMGISHEVLDATGGYKITRMGEDIEFSIRIIEQGFKTGLIPGAWVYHKRRTNVIDFFRQLHFFGRARINVSRFYPSEIKWIHTLPAFFVVCFLVWISLAFWQWEAFVIIGIIGLCLLCLLALHAAVTTKKILVGVMGAATSFIQLFAYGTGFLRELAVEMAQKLSKELN
jgi:glycosyltransferase involved in cell wall biosynthesis